MIVRHSKQVTVAIALLLMLSLSSYKFLNNQQFSNQQQQLLDQQSQLISSINLLINQHNVSSRDGLAAFISALDFETQRAAFFQWQLFDQDNELIGEQLNNKSLHETSHNQNSQTPYHFYFNGPRDQLLTLQLSLKTNIDKAITSGLTTLDIVFVLLVTGLILACIYWRFRWVFLSENYARFIAQESQSVEARIPKVLDKKASDPISQSLNQLLLSNSLLQREKVELVEQIRRISYVDPVTELGNQSFFRAEFEVRLHNHEEAESGLLMLISLLDENYEHGDKQEPIITESLLSSVAHLLRQFIAEKPHSIVAKLKHNDFAILLPNQTSDDTDKLCKTLIQQLDKAIFDNTAIKHQFINIGISAYKQGFDYSKILAEADMALRNAQLQGGNNWFMYGETLSVNKVRGNLKWRSFLQQVLDSRQWQLFGQEIQYFDPANRAAVMANNLINGGSIKYRTSQTLKQQTAIHHQEIYLRIRDDKDLLNADTFLPMAKQCGLAVEFDRQVVDGMIKHCLNQSDQSQKVLYSINLFVDSLLEPKFVAWLLAKLSSYPAVCQCLCFEIKEAHVNANLEKLQGVFEQVSRLGIRWCIENFGSPVEDHAYLELLPIAQIKLDRRICNNIHKDKVQQLYVQSLLINLASKKVAIFAEGVENQNDADYLADNGLTGLQGYYYQQPKRLTHVEEFLRAV
jgi:diguanylate cyclase (GGDEF)-like protein